MKYIVCFLLVTGALFGNEKPFVTAQMAGQLGNNLFQIAAASSLAWDNGAEPCFPELDPRSETYQHVLFRCVRIKPKRAIQFHWKEVSHIYEPISFQPDMKIYGYYQSEKYFSHHRDRILQLFAPHPKDLEYIEKKYQKLLDHPNTVGVQIRYYLWEFPKGSPFVQYGKKYLEKAMALFPKSTLFVVSSNNLDFAKKNIPAWAKNVVFLKNEANYIDLHILSKCKHNIITNSSFGWWAAWLNQNPDKIVVRPSVWVQGQPRQDVCPKDWIAIEE